MSAPSLGLTAADFDAYHLDRASSNAYSRPRLEFKQRLMAWARRVTARLQELGIAVDVHGSDEHPSVWNGHRVDCQWVFFWRDQAAALGIDALMDQRRGLAEALRDPSPYYRHAFLALRLDAQKIQVCVQLHPAAWLDFDTLKARLAQEQRSQTVLSVLSQLPEQFGIGLGDEAAVPSAQATGESLQALVERVSQESRALWVGWSVEREVAVEHSDLLDEQLEDALIALAPVYREFSWSPEDDTALLMPKLEQMREEQAKLAAQRAAEAERQKAELDKQRQQLTEKSRERTKERVDYAAPRGRLTLANLFHSDAPASAPASPATSATRPGRPSQQESPKPRSTRPEPPPSTPAAATEPARKRPAAQEPGAPVARAERPLASEEKIELVVDGGEPLDKGSRVKVLAGPFAGKLGVITELDGRGGARVLLGLLAARLALQDIAAVVERKDRPALSSSHRRAGPMGRSGKSQ